MLNHLFGQKKLMWLIELPPVLDSNHIVSKIWCSDFNNYQQLAMGPLSEHNFFQQLSIYGGGGAWTGQG